MYGGIESMLATMARHRLSIAPDSMEFALCFDGRIAGEIRAEGATVHLIGGVRARAPWTVLRARRALAHHVGGGVDALICHGTWAQGLLSLIHI